MDAAAAAVAPPLPSPPSDGRFWDRLRARVDTILEDRRVAPTCGAAEESERGKRHREDSLMLVRGLDSVAATLAQLSGTLNAAHKGVNSLAACSSSSSQPTTAMMRCHQGADKEEEEPKAKRRQCGLTENITPAAGADLPGDGSDTDAAAVEVADAKLHQEDKGDSDSVQIQAASTEVAQSTNLKRARNLAVSMAGRAAALARELKNIKSELHFMQERCGFLEEENKRLRDGYDHDNGGADHEEDDLVRLQLEALLAEKSRLAQENANLNRENQSLIQLVEYHQLTSQDLAASYEDVMQGIQLDFSSPLGKIDSDEEEGDSEDRVPVTPADKFGRSSDE